MKRAIVGFLTIAAVAAGCDHSCPQPDTIVYWTFTDAAGHATTDCVAAGISTIRIFINGNAQTDDSGNPDLSCSVFRSSGGALFATPVTGAVQLQVEGHDANGTLLYLDQRNVTLQNCGETIVNSSLAAVQGSVTVNLTGFTQCPPQGFVWYSLTDVTNPQQPALYSAIDGLTPQSQGGPMAIPCSGAVAFDNVPFGNYQLDWIQIVIQTNNPQSPYAAVWQKCSPTAITHMGNDTVTANLTAATATCPGS